MEGDVERLREPSSLNRVKRAELASGVGALVLGIGLGALFPQWFAPSAVAITVIGLTLHAFGMWDKHRLEKTSNATPPTWVTGLYWLCWISLGTVLAWILFRH